MNFTDLPYIFIGIFSGITSGLFGIGGGMIIVPSMFALGASAHHAIGISVLQMIFAAIFGSYINYKKKNLNLKDGIVIGLGGLLGASFSGILLQALSDVALTAIFLGVSCVFFIKYNSFYLTTNNRTFNFVIRKSFIKWNNYNTER